MRSLRLRARKSLLALAGFFALGTLVGSASVKKKSGGPAVMAPTTNRVP